MQGCSPGIGGQDSRKFDLAGHIEAAVDVGMDQLKRMRVDHVSSVYRTRESHAMPREH